MTLFRIGVLAAFFVPVVAVAQSPGNTSKIGVIAGPGDGGHGSVQFDGTDLGWTYEHNGQLHILFGDSWKDVNQGLMVGASASSPSTHDDVFGTLPLTDGTTIENNPPTANLAHSGSTALAQDPGFYGDVGKTPLTGFSTGTDQYVIFHTSKPLGCANDGDCGPGLTCDNGLGFAGQEYFDEAGITTPCIDGTAGCLNDTMANIWGWPIPGTGFCRDTDSSRYQNTSFGRIAAVAVRHQVGVRQAENGDTWASIEWLTNKFANVHARVAMFRGQERVLLWGRPGFAAVGAMGRHADMYFAYADLPNGNPNFTWTVHYYNPNDDSFSTNPVNAKPIISNDVDVPQQHSVAYVPNLGKWVMLYGGGLSTLPRPGYLLCGVLEIIVGGECGWVNQGNQAILMRTASNPEGPWSAASEVIAGAAHAGSSGMKLLHKPSCNTGSCAPHSPWPFYADQNTEYGVLYGVNIIPEYTVDVGNSVDLFWNVSAWDPYNVVLLKTRIDP